MTESELRADLPAATRREVLELVEACDQESSIILGLQEALVAQRAGIAANDAEAVNATVERIERILHMLREARALHEARMQALTGDPRLPLDQLERALGTALPPSFHESRRRLRRQAEQIAQEVAVNSTVLGRATEAGETFLQAVFSAALDTPAAYGRNEPKPETQGGASLFLNRVV